MTYDELVAAIEATPLTQRPALLAVAVKAAVPCFRPGKLALFVANVLDPQAMAYPRKHAFGGPASRAGGGE